jgi:adenylyl-sulfate kinase
MQKGFTLWMTGLPCSGKSTLAEALVPRLRALGRNVELLDGDLVRTHLCKGLGFSREDRDTNIRRIGFVCHLLSRNGVIAIGAAISPYKAIRDELREEIGDFVECYVDAPLELCIQRDVKGMYAKALRGEMKGFTGIDDPYEPPDNPELRVQTEKLTLDESVELVLATLRKLEYL